MISAQTGCERKPDPTGRSPGGMIFGIMPTDLVGEMVSRDGGCVCVRFESEGEPPLSQTD
jgi:hypothetical protein